MRTTYYNVKLNNGDVHTIYSDQDTLEAMMKVNIIQDYNIALDSWDTERIIRQYIADEFVKKGQDICYNIQKVKGINNGELPPDLRINLYGAIGKVSEVVAEIIEVQQEIDEEAK